MQVRCDIEDLIVRSVDLDDIGVLRSSHKLRQLYAVLIMQRDQRSNQVGACLPSFATFPVAIAAGGIVSGEAASDRVLWIDLESRASSATAAATTTARCCACRRLSGGRLSLHRGN